MYAVIETGSKQYFVEKGTKVEIEKLDVEGAVKFDQVLLVASGIGGRVEIGQPYLKEVVVEGTILKQFRDDKKMIYKFKRKTGYHRKKGHRQSMTEVLIENIILPSALADEFEQYEKAKEPVEATVPTQVAQEDAVLETTIKE